VKPKILVVGDLIIDHYLWGESNRISPEAPVVIVDVKKEEFLLGGAGNVVKNLLALGCEVGVISVVGDDEWGEWIEEKLRKIGVGFLRLFREKGRKTSKKTRVLSANQQIVRFDKESTHTASSLLQQSLIKECQKIVHKFDMVLLSDYAKGVLSHFVTQEIIKLFSKKTLIDPKGEDYSKYRGAFLITPNKKEASLACKMKIKDEETLKTCGEFLKNKFEIENVVITLSEEGMAIFEKRMQKIPTAAKEVYDVTGAGDTVLAALGYKLAKGSGLKEAAEFANFAAGVVVSKIGAATATLAEIEEYKRALHKESTSELIKSFEEIEKISKEAKLKGKKVVFTNGCFDLLHIGHIKYLQKAKSFGDMLIVGLNSDKSVKRLKGQTRPIMPQEDRAYLLASLEMVDYVVIFEEDTPYKLISKVKPDVLVKGGDYEEKEIVGRDIAKRVEVVEFVPNKSTSAIIEKIKGLR
jgi:D-beta-D-heptose 7-phosphate kinase/D-beta-D-heptose 1-phosphate adenosyltransferase